MEKVLLYNDESFYSDYYFIDEIAVISQNKCDGSEESFVCVEIEHLRKIIEDYDLNYGGVNE